MTRLFAIVPVVLSALALAACSEQELRDDLDTAAQGGSQIQIIDAPADPNNPNTKYLGHTKSDLIAERGQPSQIMNATLLGGSAAEAYVYPPSTPAGCFDAFVVDEKTGHIIKYFCR